MASTNEPQGCDRTPKRSRVLMIATLFTPEGAQRVRVRDISSEGAQILPERTIPAGCDAIFKKGEIFAAARVAWANDMGVGLNFYRKLPLAEVQTAFNDTGIELAG